MSTFSRAEAAEAAGISGTDLDRYIGLGLISPAGHDAFSGGDVRRAALVQSVTQAGIPIEGLATAVRSGVLSLTFLDEAIYDRFSALSRVTFAQLAEQTGVPVELLMVIREATGSAQPSPADLVREDELAIAPFVQMQVELGFNHSAIERLLRGHGDSLRRMAAAEAEWWQAEVIMPRLEAGGTADDVSSVEFADRLAAASERAILNMWHAHQQHGWTQNILNGFELALTRAGLVSRLERPPAMCFLDITGYTRLTQERGDEAAADLATRLSRLVERTSVQHTGRPVKWLGDGVMFFFRDPGPGVVAALEMVDGVADAGLPPAHVGLHAGPVIFQQGDYYGQTVNLASRIAEYARPGEVLVSQAVVDAAADEGGTLRYAEIGPVELKGVGGTVHLHSAHRAG